MAQKVIKVVGTSKESFRNGGLSGAGVPTEHTSSFRKSLRYIASRDGVVLREIQDQGKGIPQNKLIEMDSVGLPGVGIRGMRERIGQLGGHLEISSSGNGTAIRARLPFAGVASSAVA